MKRISDALKSAPRVNFLPPAVVSMAENDVPLSIGYGVTNSQPSTVVNMLEWLKARSGQKVLDVGSGSGWSSALLAYLVGARGSVTAVERLPQLVRIGQENCKRLGIENISFHKAGNIFGWPDNAPYDRILVSAAATSLPVELIEQLAKGGRMVIPVKSSIIVIERDSADKIHKETHPGFAFVPLVSAS